ncbi:hypothetical protein MMC10_006991 [Thelotrema lepadinum]|nr:hypothetical protein [Thelotrema lepadinum]
MGRKKHQHPSRAEKERLRKLRHHLFKRAKITSQQQADVYVVVRCYGVFYKYTSSKTHDWPPSKEEASGAIEVDIPLATEAKIDDTASGIGKQKELEEPSTSIQDPFDLLNVTAAKAPTTLLLNSPPLLQESPVETRQSFQSIFERTDRLEHSYPAFDFNEQ